MAVTTTRLLPNQLDKEIESMFYDSFTRSPPLWSRFMKRTKWPKGYGWTTAALAGLGGTLTAAAEGEPTMYDVPSEGNKITRYPLKFQKGFQVTEEMLEDELFDKINALPGSLARVATNTIEVRNALLWNNPNSTTYNTTDDGKAMCANDHHTLRSPAGTAYDNYVSADLDTTSLQAAMQWFQNLVGEDDLPIDCFLSKLMVGLNDQWKANELLKATGRVFDTANGDMNRGLVYNSTGLTYETPSANFGPNMLNPSMGVVSQWDIIVNRYLIDTDSWFGLSNLFNGEIAFKREAKMQSADEIGTGNRIYRCSMRFLPIVREWRGLYGSVGV